jgi:acetolactate synthase-1/2/3 large subunit
MKMTGGEIIVKYLEKEGVPYILGIPGHGCLGLFDAIKKSQGKGGVKYIQVKHEQAAMHIADGYFRMTGKPLAVFTSIGPGALNTAIGLGTAYVDSTAVLLFTGDTHVHMKGVGVLQEIERYQDSNFIRALEPLSKRAWRVESVCQLPRIMQRAFNQMLTGRSGPVVISLPMDVQSETADVELPESLFRRTNAKAAGQAEYVDAAIELMRTAKRPVILAGGAALRARASAELIELAELWGAAVVTTIAGKSAFPEDHPLYGWHTGSKGTTVGLKLCSGADVILALGTRFADETTCSYRDGVSFSFPKTKLIQVDIEAGEIGKNYACDVGIIGDLKVVLGQLTEAYKEKVSDKKYFMDQQYTKEIAQMKREWFRYIEEVRKVTCEHITISQMIGELNECLPEDAVVVTSSGNTQAQIFQEYCFKRPMTHLTTGGFSTMGFALPAAIGAKLARPATPVIAVMGDGDLMMVMQELSTLAQYNIPVVTVMANNCGWMAIKDLQMDVFGEKGVFGTDFEKGGEAYSPDFKSIAESFGLHAEKVSKPGEIAGAVTRALAANAPAFIEVEVSREYPYSGGKAFGWWDVPIPGYYEDIRKQYEINKAMEKV